MLHRLLADAVMGIHFGYLVYLVVGGFLAWRWSRASYPHVVAGGWAVGIVFVGFQCPLTGIERRLRSEAGGFGVIDRYLEGVVYPEEFTTVLRVAVAVLAAVAYRGRLRRRTPRLGPV